MNARLRLAVAWCLFCLTAACSSDDTEEAEDPGDTPEQASCTFPSDDGPTCVDYQGDAQFVDILRDSCMASDDGVLAEGELCPTAGVSGICSDEGSNRSRLFYYDVTEGLGELEAACTVAGGTWSTG